MNSVWFVQQFKPMELEYRESHRLEANVARAFHKNIVFKLRLWDFYLSLNPPPLPPWPPLRLPLLPLLQALSAS